MKTGVDESAVNADSMLVKKGIWGEQKNVVFPNFWELRKEDDVSVLKKHRS